MEGRYFKWKFYSNPLRKFIVSKYFRIEFYSTSMKSCNLIEKKSDRLLYHDMGHWERLQLFFPPPYSGQIPNTKRTENGSLVSDFECLGSEDRVLQQEDRSRSSASRGVGMLFARDTFFQLATVKQSK